jgi:hypothetical protein
VVPASTSNVDASQLTSTCDSLTFLADITIPDNVDIPPKTTFKKTWAVRNNGLCTWNSNYAVVWVGGDQLGAPASAPILEPGMYIRPGEMALITVTLKAPDEMNRQRNYTSNWKLRNDKGQNFGWGPNSDRSLYVAFWASYYYSFLENQCSAVWSNSDGALYCPGSEQEPVGGYVYKDNPQLENGFGGGPSFYIVPPKQENGQVSARFAPVVIPPGSVWKAEWNCAYGGQLCNFHATVTAVVEGGAENLVGEVYKYYDGLTAPMDIDLKNYEGQAVAFTITVDTNGGPEDDRIILRNPRIEPK